MHRQQLKNAFGICAFSEENIFQILLFRMIQKFLCVNKNINIFLTVNLGYNTAQPVEASSCRHKLTTHASLVCHSCQRVSIGTFESRCTYGSLLGCDAVRSCRWCKQSGRLPATYSLPTDFQLSESLSFLITHTHCVRNYLLDPWRGLLI